MGLRLSNRQLLMYGLVILLIGIAIGSVSLTYPFGRDQAFYAYAGSLLLEGKMNYHYVFDLKPPGSHLFFAIGQIIFGETMFNIRIFDILWQSATAFIIFMISYKLTIKKFLSIISSFVYLLLYYRQDYWHTLQADGMLNLPFAISILLLISSYYEHSFLKIFIAGILFSLALIFKYTVISYLPLVIICILFSFNELKSIRFKNIMIFLLGVIILSGTIAIWYLLKGALGDMTEIQFGQTSQYTKIAYETESSEFILKNIFRLFTFSVYSPLIWFSIFGFVILFIKRKHVFPNLLILSWIVSSLFSLIVQWKFYHYHFLVIIASLSIGSVLFASFMIDYVKENRRKSVIIAFAVILIGFVMYAGTPYIGNYQTLFSYFSGKENLNEVYIKNGITTDSVFMIKKTFNVIDFVNQNSSMNDKIYVWGYDPLVYYLTGRHCVSRFVYNIPLLWKADNAIFRREFMNEINKTNPKLIIIASNDPLYYISGYNEDSKQLLQRFPEFNSFINSKYSYKTTIDDYELYELKNW